MVEGLEVDLAGVGIPGGGGAAADPVVDAQQCLADFDLTADPFVLFMGGDAVDSEGHPEAAVIDLTGLAGLGCRFFKPSQGTDTEQGGPGDRATVDARPVLGPLDQAQVDTTMCRDGLGEGSGNRPHRESEAVEADLDRITEFDRALHGASVRKAQRKLPSAGLAPVLGDDPHQWTDAGGADHVSVVADQEELPVVDRTLTGQLDLWHLMHPEALDGGGRNPCHGRAHENPSLPLRGFFHLEALAALIGEVSDETSLLELIDSSERVVALTGAGISTASGIPDFRSPGGLWDDEDPMEVATLTVFGSDPERFWRFYRARLDLADTYRPNAGHLLLAHLAELDKLSAVVTQNIDGLHQAAGVDEGIVYEVHGSVRELTCLACAARYPRARLDDLVEDGLPRCSCGEILKPAVVLFEEMLPEDAVENSLRSISECDLLLVIGSSMVVHPVAGFPGYRPESSSMAIINNEMTSWGPDADIWLDGDIAERSQKLSLALGFD